MNISDNHHTSSSSRKGIKVLQLNPQQNKTKQSQQSSGIKSIRSKSRSRGITMSRQSGIKLDKIYEPKHFPPIPVRQQPSSNTPDKEIKSIATCKSLKFLSLASQKTLSSSKQKSAKEPCDNRKEYLVSEFKQNEEAMNLPKQNIPGKIPVTTSIIRSKSKDKKRKENQHHHPNLIAF